MISIVLTGPESSGKTTLAHQLAEHFGTDWVPEFARGYLEKLSRDYVEDDLVEIAKGQVASEMTFAEQNENLLFLDTSLEVLKIWSEVRFGECHPYILENLRQQKHDLYLLCRPDLKWVFDPQRENPHDRWELLKTYRSELTTLNVNFVEIEGIGAKRLKHAVDTVLHFQKLTTASQ